MVCSLRNRAVFFFFCFPALNFAKSSTLVLVEARAQALAQALAQAELAPSGVAEVAIEYLPCQM